MNLSELMNEVIARPSGAPIVDPKTGTYIRRQDPLTAQATGAKTDYEIVVSGNQVRVYNQMGYDETMNKQQFRDWVWTRVRHKPDFRAITATPGKFDAFINYLMKVKGIDEPGEADVRSHDFKTILPRKQS